MMMMTQTQQQVTQALLAAGLCSAQHLRFFTLVQLGKLRSSAQAKGQEQQQNGDLQKVLRSIEEAMEKEQELLLEGARRTEQNEKGSISNLPQKKGINQDAEQKLSDVFSLELIERKIAELIGTVRTLQVKRKAEKLQSYKSLQFHQYSFQKLKKMKAQLEVCFEQLYQKFDQFLQRKEQEEEEYRKMPGGNRDLIFSRAQVFIQIERSKPKKKCCKYLVEEQLFSPLENQVYIYFRRGIVQFQQEVKKINVQKLQQLKTQLESDILAIELNSERFQLSAMRTIVVKAIQKKKRTEKKLESGGLWQRVSSFFSAEKAKNDSNTEIEKNRKVAKTEDDGSLFSDDQDQEAERKAE